VTVENDVADINLAHFRYSRLCTYLSKESRTWAFGDGMPADIFLWNMF